MAGVPNALSREAGGHGFVLESRGGVTAKPSVEEQPKGPAGQ
jgi:hypothetical protein